MSDGAAQIRILTVDDHALVRQGIAVLVGTQPDMTLVGEASNGREAIQRFRTHRPDGTLMDLQMPEMNGFDAMLAIRGEFPDAKPFLPFLAFFGTADALSEAFNGWRNLRFGNAASGVAFEVNIHISAAQRIRIVVEKDDIGRMRFDIV